MRGVVAGLSLGLSLGCGPSGYECSTDASCGGGYCEVTGYCSLDDDKCASGRRYVDLAGPFSGKCVAAAAASTTDNDSTGVDPGSSDAATSNAADDDSADDGRAETDTGGGMIGTTGATTSPSVTTTTDDGATTADTTDGGSDDSMTTGTDPSNPYTGCMDDMECPGGICQALFMDTSPQCLYMCSGDQSCPATPMGDPTPVCFQGVCILPCGPMNASCPDGMECNVEYYPMCVAP